MELTRGSSFFQRSFRGYSRASFPRRGGELIFNHMMNNPALASWVEKISVEVVDKSVSLLVAVVATICIHDLLALEKEGKVKEGTLS